MRQARAFWFAVQFLTRLPTPSSADLTAAETASALAASRLWFPFVGGLVGGIAALAYLAAHLLWPMPVAVVIALGTEALVTGAFHEDAVADFFDAMGGGTTREAKLAILRDSRIGSYGALGLFLAIAARAAFLIALPPALVPPALLAAGAAGRWTILVVMSAVAPVHNRAGLASALARLRIVPMLTALMLAAPALAWAFVTRAGHTIGALLACAVFALVFARWLERKLGGSTGDCLGTAAYAGTLIMLASLAIDVHS